MLLSLKKMPFVRLLIFFIAGILLQWYFKFSIKILLIDFTSISVFITAFSFLASSKKFSLQWLQGLLLLSLVMIAGSVCIYQKDIRNHPHEINNFYKPKEIVKATLLEPLVEKPKSFKALAQVNSIFINNKWQAVDGKALIYFKKDSSAKNLSYGSQIVFSNNLQTISNAGNPGEFDYKQYCLFNNIQQQVYLKNDEYVLLETQQTSVFQSFLFASRNYILQTLRENIPEKKEQSIAEALLIGYRDDVDKDLLEAYHNTGVVHIIVISGLHMGIIYALAVWLISFFKRIKVYKIIKLIFLLSVIWFFALLTGGKPSILRVTTMLSFIIVGNAINRKSNVYNTLAASAFCLLLINPFALWDAGFQLSFAAVASIVTFYKPVYNWFFVQNKLLKKLWELSAVTIAVQFFTMPFVLFHFHKFPFFFLITNLISVPVAVIILYLELFLLIIAKWKWLAAIVGKAIAFCISTMNIFIERTNNLPFSTTGNVYNNILQTIILFIIITSFSVWLMKKSSKAFMFGLTSLCIFVVLKSVNFFFNERQEKLIVYNIPKQNSIDIINGRNYSDINSNAAETQSQQDFYLTPARIFFHANDENKKLLIQFQNNLIQTPAKNIFILNKSFTAKNIEKRISLDAIIISQNPNIDMNAVKNIFDCKEIIFDSSNPMWKIAQWSKQCDSLHLRFHSVPKQGAFVMDL